MEKLIKTVETHSNTKYRQNDGSPTMAGWGFIKKSMRNFVKMLRDSGKNVIFIAHVEEKMDEERLVKRPMIATKISEELINLVDIVGYMTSVISGEEEKRMIVVDSGNDKFIAKDRTGQLGKIIPPNFIDIISAIQGTKKFKWAKSLEDKVPEKAPEKALEKKTILKKEVERKENEEETIEEIEETESDELDKSIEDKLSNAKK
jgi:hypothetical protein